MTARAQRDLRLFKKAYPWVQTPLIVSAPMRVFASPSLAVASSSAGGIGFIGPPAKPDEISQLLTEARQHLKYAKSLGGYPGTSIPIGIGFQTFDSDLSLAVQAVHEHKPAIVWLFAPREGQRELDTWSQKLRGVSPRIRIWIQVGSVRDALEVAKSSMPPDVLVLQGNDAGGHGLVRSAGIISLLPEVLDAFDREKIDVPVLAAGGIADGRGVAAVLSLGAIGAVMGTRFLASTEAKISKGYQNDVLRTFDGGINTVRTKLYDELAGRKDWPGIFDGRNIVNQSILDHESGMEFEDNQKLYKEALTKGDDGWGENGRLTEFVGSAVGLVKRVNDAADIVERTREEARTVLKQASTLA